MTEAKVKQRRKTSAENNYWKRKRASDDCAAGEKRTMQSKSVRQKSEASATVNGRAMTKTNDDF